MMLVRKCTKEDIADVMKIICEAKAYFKENHIPQWQNANGYPNVIDIEKDIQKQGAYCIEADGKIVAYSFIANIVDPNYAYIEGSWLNAEKYVVVHRTCVTNSMKGKHVASLFFTKAKEIAKENNIHNIRVDTHACNTSMRHLLENNHFQQCGIIYVEDKTPRMAYQSVF